MNFYLKNVFLSVLVSTIAIQVEGAHGTCVIKCGDKLAAKKYYAPAAEAYEKALVAKKISTDSLLPIRQKLAMVYMKMGNTLKAEMNFAPIVNAGKANSDLLFEYARALQSNGKYADAITVFDKLAATEKTSTNRYQQFSALSSDALVDRVSNDKIQFLPFNTQESEYAPAFYNKGLAFTSSRFTTNQPTHRLQWNGVLFTDLYTVEEDSKGGLTQVSKLPEPLNSKLNDGAACFDKTGNEIFFTRNNRKQCKRNELQILYSRFDGTKWQTPKPLSFEMNGSNFSHPFLSADGNTLYFSSDMTGGFGGMDLYSTQRNGSNWETPVNLGSSVNTKGNELFPFVAENGTLYFTSDGQAGYGGLDIFSAKKEGNLFVNATNLGYDINSSKDDLSFITDTKNGESYFSSNRKGDDDIYFTKVATPASVAATIASKKPALKVRSGMITETITKMGVENARVEIFNNASAITGSVFYTNDHGEFFYFDSIASTDIIRITKEGYAEKTITGVTKNWGDTSTLNLNLEVQKKPAPLAPVVVYFAVDKSNLTLVEIKKIDQLLDAMKALPKSKIQLSGYADEQGKSTYNNTLSMQRAKGVEKYLVEKGIVPSQIQTTFFGAVKIDEACRKITNCVTTTNKQNRRVEITVVEEK